MTGRWAIELSYKGWHEMTPDEIGVYEHWLAGATAADLHMLLRHVYRDAKRRHVSTIEQLKTIGYEDAGD